MAKGHPSPPPRPGEVARAPAAGARAEYVSSVARSQAEKDTLVYDGACALCRSSARGLARLLPPERLEAISFRDPGVLGRFPGLDEAACDREVKLVRSDGRVFSGAEAVVQALRGRPFGLLLRAYYLPGMRQVGDRLYRAVARRRARLG